MYCFNTKWIDEKNKDITTEAYKWTRMLPKTAKVQTDRKDWQQFLQSYHGRCILCIALMCSKVRSYGTILQQHELP